ncbi:hypothetical protein [Agromyces sp. PvR057]|uniref:hypothetical protein n=1 Tax=Agromyces sp. PvR057 TaxID=3156403 RepID=UPI0033961726
MTSPTRADARLFEVLWRADQYRGESDAYVAATQLDHKERSAAQRRRIFAGWIESFSTATTALARLHLVSRVPQEPLDSLTGQPQLSHLQVKWGPYRDVTALIELNQLQSLRLGGATNLHSLEPLARLPKLTELSIDRAHRLDDPLSLGSFTRLTSLSFGNGYAGSDKSVVLPDLEWVRPLQELRTLALPGIRLLNSDLSPILELPRLEQLRLPLRRQFRRQVLEFAETSSVFAEVATEYEALDSWRD